jgi:hypothetical protein
MRLAKVRIFTSTLIIVVFLILFKCSICVGQTSNSLEDMNKRELRSLADYLIFKTDSLQELLNKTVRINTDLTSALSDSIMKIAKLNKQLENANNTLYLKDTEINQINSQIIILNDSLKLVVSKFKQLENELMQITLENQSLKDSLTDAQFKIQILKPDIGESIEEEITSIKEDASTSEGKKNQKYSGTYPYGKATYTYYDDENGNRIYNGTFYYTTLENESYKWRDQFNLNDYREIEGNPFCKGNYSLNNKTGAWSFGTTYSYGKNDTIYAAYGTFKNDLPNGVFHFILNNQYSKNKRIFDFYVNYKDGVPNGKISFKCSGNDNMRWEGDGQSKVIKSIEMSGALSSNGLPSGEWTIKYQLETFSFQRKDLYLNGTLIRSELKDYATGNVIFSQDFSNNYKANPNANGNEYFSENFEYHPYLIDKLLLFLKGTHHNKDSYEEDNTNYIFPNSLIWMGKM